MKRNTLIIVTIVALVTLVVAGRFYFSEASYSATNPFWDSLGMATSIYGTYNLYSLQELSGAGEGSTLLVIGPTKDYTPGEASLILDYLNRGGRVVVMDDYGTANTLLKGLNSPVLLNQTPLCQSSNYYENPSFPVISNISGIPETRNVKELVLNHPVSLNLTGPALVVANTSQLGWLDIVDNGYVDVDENEKFNEYTVIASMNYDRGELLIIGDPDIITNGMLDKGDNRIFIDNILSEGAVYVDMSHGHEMPPLAQILYVIRTDLIAQIVCTLLILIGGYACYRRTDIIGLLNRFRAGEEEYMDEKESMISYMESKFLLSEHEISEMNKKL